MYRKNRPSPFWAKPDKQPAVTNNKQLNLLFNLPLEIRTQIYELLLVHTDARRIKQVCRQHTGCTYTAVKEPPLLFVSKKVRKETLKVFYSSNVFHVATSALLVPWLAKLTPEKRAMLRHIRGPQLPHQVRVRHGLLAAWEKAKEFESRIGYAGLSLERGVFRAPAKVKEGKDGLLWWVSCSSWDVVATAVNGSMGEVVRKVRGGRLQSQEGDERGQRRA